MGHNRENFGAMLKSIIGNLKSIIGAGVTSIPFTTGVENELMLRKLQH